MPITFVGATPILGTVRCSDIEARLETPLDTHTEARFKKYLDGFSTPKTLASEEEAKRWCYLFELRESIEATNRVHRQDFRTRTLLQRFDNINVDTTGEKTTPPAAPLTDVELSDLPPSRQAKILRKLRLRNCTEGGGTTEEIEEYAICIKELAKAIESSDDAVLRRRVERLSERVSQPSTPSESSRSQETGDYTRGTAAQDLQSIHQAVVDVRTFDLHGPGSQPLSVPIEAKIKPYAERHDCSRVSIGESKIRCEWLVQYSYYLRKLNPSRSEANLRSLGLLNGVLLRRGVNQTYRSAVESTQGILNTRRLQGFRPSPRTIQDLKENFQSPVVVPGDCQVDPKLCNK
ncbi:MAG TPA: hypothetical protein VJB82_02740 [Candidatus Peribacterales bacterium]|nr:hypothetical protein [Candidatus Peribacterales bacterium]